MLSQPVDQTTGTDPSMWETKYGQTVDKYGLVVAKGVGLVVLAILGWYLWTTIGAPHLPAGIGYHPPSWHAAAAIIGTIGLTLLAVGVVLCEQTGQVGCLVFAGLVLIFLIYMTVLSNTSFAGGGYCDGFPC